MTFFQFLFVWVIAFLMPLYGAEPPELTWDVLANLDIDKKATHTEIEAFSGKDVRVIGFIVPLDFGEDFYTVTELLLVPDPLACIHVPPPPPNQMIHVKMNKAIPIDMDFRGVELTGTFKLEKGESDYGEIFYTMVGKKAVALDIEYVDPFDELDAEIDRLNALEALEEEANL
tara:strand:- start:1638 stop:2156 length:519 start_codon:yes stop_codon:yes gene_type:complete